MKKTILLIFIGMGALVGAVSGLDLLDTAEISLKHAARGIPAAYRYYEKAGAFGINRTKAREYSIDQVNNTLIATVTLADEGRHHKDDPRPPAQVGDASPLDFAKIIQGLNPFSTSLRPSGFGGREESEIDDIEVYKFDFSYTTYDDDGSGYPTTGTLYIDRDTGMARRIHAVREETPEEVDGEFWLLDFGGTGPEDCRLLSRYYEKKGKYAIFVYKFRTTETFTY